jgi:undecaprenyl diphosphate synthase
VEHAPDVGIGRLTVYAFSTENWRRPASEVQAIFWLLRAFLRLETERLRQRGVRLQVIGRRDRVPKLAVREIEKAEAATAHGQRLHLRVAIDYSSRESIAFAARVACTHFSQWQYSTDMLVSMLAQALTVESCDVDLLIRTGGEKRLSDFLLWESAYAELLFTDRMWPDFDEADLDAALEEFRHRERRFGSVPDPAVVSAGGAQ